jgi:hypothetical protein
MFDTDVLVSSERQLEADYHRNCALAAHEEEATRCIKDLDAALMNLPLHRRKEILPDWWFDDSCLEQDEL